MTSALSLLITCDLTLEALAMLRAQNNLKIEFSKSQQPTAEELQDAQALLVRSGTKVNEHLIKQCPKLKFVVTATSGFDHIDLNFCKKQNIAVSFCPQANAESAAQWTMTLMLNLLRQFPKTTMALEQNKWREGLKRGLELSGLQLGLIGLGRIGSRVAELAQVFQMNVVAHDPYVEMSHFEKLGVKPLGLIEVFKTSDVVSFHVPLTKDTRHMINHRTLEHLNPDAYLINASRGGVIDETELAVRMRTGLLSGAALDVFEKEPLASDSPLKGLNNVILTPHVGAFTEQAFTRGSQEAANKVISFLRGEPVSDLLPPPTPWAAQLL